MVIRICCPSCNQSIPVPVQVKGRFARCPFCEEIFKVPRVVLPFISVRRFLDHERELELRALLRALLAGVVATVALTTTFGVIWMVTHPPLNDKHSSSGNFEDAIYQNSPDHLKALSDSYLREHGLQGPGQTTKDFGENLARISPQQRLIPFENLPDLVEHVEPAVVRINTYGKEKGTASGFVIHPTGIVITNYHVLIGVEEAHVLFHDRRLLRVLGALLLAPEKDLAILKIDTPREDFPALQLAPNPPRKGTEVMAFGAPLGLSFSTTRGIVSGVRVPSEMRQTGISLNVRWIQTDAPILAGNSGGPLVNLRGEVVGVNTITSGPDSQNLNFAIAADEIHEVLHLASPVAIPLTKEIFP